MSELPFLRDLVVPLLLSLAIVLIFRRLRQPSVVRFLAAVLTLQSLTGVAAVWGLGLGLRASVLAGLAVAQVGEFSFVLAQAGFALGVLDAARYQVFLANGSPPASGGPEAGQTPGWERVP